MKLPKKPIIIFTVVLICGLLIAGGLWWWFSRTTLTAPENQFGYQALKINGKYVDPAVFAKERNDFFRRYFRNAEMSRKSDEERNDLLLDEIIDRMVLEEFLLNKSGIQVTPAEIDQYIERYIKSKYPTPVEMKEYMEHTGCKTEADLRRVVQIYLLKIKYFPAIAKGYGITVSDAEVKAELERQKKENRYVIIKHILIAFKEHPPQEAEELAGKIYTQLQNGADFEKLARQYSDDLSSKSKGGKLPPLDKGIVPDEYQKVLFDAKPGQIIPPFSTNDGYEITYIDRYVSYHHPEAELKNIMLTERFGKSEHYKDWLAKIKSQMDIEITGPEFKAFRYHKAGKYNEAGRLYEEVYAKKQLESYFINAIQNYHSARNWDKVIALGRIGIRKFDSKIQYYLFMGEGLYHKQQTAEALKNLETAWKLAADSVVYQDLVFKAYDRLGLKRPGTGKIIFPTPVKKLDPGAFAPR